MYLTWDVALHFQFVQWNTKQDATFSAEIFQQEARKPVNVYGQKFYKHIWLQTQHYLSKLPYTVYSITKFEVIN